MSGTIDFDSIRRSNPIESYCQNRGIQLHKHGGYLTGRCPIHNEQNGEAFAVWPNEGKWRCFGKCSQGGDILDLEKILGGGTVKEAAERLAGHLDPVPIIWAPKPEQEKPKKQYHPDLRRPSISDLGTIEDKRSICWDALKIAADERGFLWMAELHGHLAWVITDKSRKGYLARRLDGGKWEHLPTRPKAYLLPGSNGNWPIGILEAEQYPAIALCEGSPDFLAAFGHAWASEVEDLVAPVCMSSASPDISKDALPSFTDKRVRIFVHDDQAGYKAALKWKSQLKGIAGKVDRFAVDGLRKSDGQLTKDLNDLLLIDYDEWERNQAAMDSIMDFAREGRN